MSRPDLQLSAEQSAGLKGQDWTVPDHAIVAEDRGREVRRWSETGVLTAFKVDQVDGEIRGEVRLLISDEDHHRNTNPRQSLALWPRVNPDMARMGSKRPEKETPDYGKYWRTVFAVRMLESLIKALGETGLLTGRRHLTDFGSLYDFLAATDLSGREVLVQLQYPPFREDQVEPDVRYFEPAL